MVFAIHFIKDGTEVLVKYNEDKWYKGVIIKADDICQDEHGHYYKKCIVHYDEDDTTSHETLFENDFDEANNEYAWTMADHVAVTIIKGFIRNHQDISELQNNVNDLQTKFDELQEYKCANFKKKMNYAKWAIIIMYLIYFVVLVSFCIYSMLIQRFSDFCNDVMPYSNMTHFDNLFAQPFSQPFSVYSKDAD